MAEAMAVLICLIWVITHLSFLIVLFILKYTKLKNEVKKIHFWNGFFKTLTDISFSGRASRIEFVNFNIILTLLNIFVIPYASFQIFSNIIKFTSSIKSPITIITTLLMFLLLIWIFLANFAVSVKRWHDFNKTYWICFGIAFAVSFVNQTIIQLIKDSSIFAILSFVPFIASCVLFIIACVMPGTEGKNNFGRNPFDIESYDKDDNEDECEYEYVYVEEEENIE